MTDEKFISINGKSLKSPIVLSSMAGISNADYVIKRARYAGMAIIGGYNIDDAASTASKIIQEGGRKEFDDSFENIAVQIQRIKEADSSIAVGLNLRGTTPDAFLEAAEYFGHDIIYEIDSHCRQKPMIDAKSGEYFLKNPEKLCEIVSTLSDSGYYVSVKTRAGIADDAKLAKMLWKAGADIIHVDLMDHGYTKLRQIRNSCPLVIIGNNGVKNPDKMMDYFSHGADLVSLARGADPDTIMALYRFINSAAENVGWYNAPKQLCRGGDLRSLAFCCMPIKQCPLLPTLSKIDMSKEHYLELKTKAVEGNELSHGAHTCFGSLAFCCKSSTPCMFREMTLKTLNIENSRYMKLKRDLSEAIMSDIFGTE